MKVVLAFRFVVALFIVVAATSASAWSMIAYGDSLTSDPMGDSLKWCGERIDLPNTCMPRGQSGETTRAGVDRLLADLQLGFIPATTDYVVLAWGANDLRSDTWNAETEILDPLRTVATALIEAGHVPVFWTPNPQFQLATPPFVISQLVDIRISHVVAPGVLNLASEFDSAPVANHFDEYWSLGDAEMAPLYADHVHQNAAGYAFMATTVQIAANAHYVSVPEPDGFALSIAALAALVVIMAASRVRRKASLRVACGKVVSLVFRSDSSCCQTSL